MNHRYTMNLGKYQIYLDLSINKKIYSIFLIVFGFGSVFLGPPSTDRIPARHELREVSSVWVRQVTKRSGTAYVFDEFPENESKSKKRGWLVPLYQFDPNLEDGPHQLQYIPENIRRSIKIYVFENSRTPKVWIVKIGDKEIISYERSIAVFRDEMRVAQEFKVFGIFCLMLIPVLTVRARGR